MDAAASYLVTDILADNNARAATFGLDSLLATRGFAAVKTGTSKDMRDNWCVGFTDRYTVGVWVGNASGAPMQAVSGVSGAAPVWARVVGQLHQGSRSRPPAPPAGVVRRAVRFAGWVTPEVGRTEWFKHGTQQAVWQVQTAPSARAIQHPQDGAVYALDPDMPPGIQQLTFKASDVGAPQALSWWLDGVLIGRGHSLDWSPRPGRHRLELRWGNVMHDQIGFEVRGARLKFSK
jgi:penicillin-binding protein 1C